MPFCSKGSRRSCLTWRCTVHALGRSAEAHRNPGSGTPGAPMSLISAQQSFNREGWRRRAPGTVLSPGTSVHRVGSPGASGFPWQKTTRRRRSRKPPSSLRLVRADFAPEGAPSRFSPVLSDPLWGQDSCSTNDYEFVMRTWEEYGSLLMSSLLEYRLLTVVLVCDSLSHIHFLWVISHNIFSDITKVYIYFKIWCSNIFFKTVVQQKIKYKI